VRPATKEEFLASLRSGDIGIIRADNVFAKLQNWYRKKFKEGELAASHGFYVRNPPRIAEANGMFITNDSTVVKNIGDKTKCWIFRYTLLTAAQRAAMNASADVAVQVGGHYSVGGIAQFALQFFGIRKKLADEGGVFCTEFTGDLIVGAGIPYVEGKGAFEIDPSYQLNWMLSPEAQEKHWILAGLYDGANYLIA
jgi:hypothetical protein